MQGISGLKIVGRVLCK